jgi:hypothetical protein
MAAEGSARSFQAQVPRVGGRGITLKFRGHKFPEDPKVSLIQIPKNIINFVDPM